MAELTATEMTARQKAAVVVLSLGAGADTILRELGGSEVELLAEQILQLGDVPEEVRDEVLTEFQNRLSATQAPTSGPLERAAEVLEVSLGKAAGDEALKRMEWRANQDLIRFAKKDPAKMAELVAVEHPQTIAFLMTQIDAELSGRVISEMDEEIRPEIAWRIANMSEIAPHTAGAVHRALGPMVKPEEAGVVVERLEQVGGEKKVADLLNMVTVEMQRDVFESMESKDSDQVMRIRKLMFVFRDLLLLDDRGMQRVLKEVDQKDLSLALYGADEDVKDKFFRNMSSRAAETIRDEMEFMAQVKKEDVEAARDRIIESVRTLEEQGEVVVNRGGEE